MRKIFSKQWLIALVLAMVFAIGASFVAHAQNSPAQHNGNNSYIVYPQRPHPDYTSIRIQGEKDCAVAPKGYDPLKFTPQQIAYYGFPERPLASDREALQRWVFEVSGIKYRSCTGTIGVSYTSWDLHP